MATMKIETMEPQLISYEVSKSQKAFMMIATPQSEWKSPFSMVLKYEDEFIDNGCTEWERCQMLEVGECLAADDYEGVYFIRIS